MTPLQQRILDVLRSRAGKWTTKRQIAGEAGCKESSVKIAICRMRNEHGIHIRTGGTFVKTLGYMLG